MKSLLATLMVVLLFASPLVRSEQSPAPADTAALAEGEIRKIDKAAGKVTIKHGRLENLDMMPMTMVFRVKEATWLEQMKEGEKIRFLAERVNGALTVVRYEVVK